MRGAVVGAVIIGVVVFVIVWSQTRRRGGTEIGVRRHRRHMDALSSDARREVIERVRDSDRGRREG